MRTQRSTDTHADPHLHMSTHKQTNKETTYICKKHQYALFCCATFTAAVCVREIMGRGLLGNTDQQKTLGLCDNPTGEFNPFSFILIHLEREWNMENLIFIILSSSKLIFKMQLKYITQIYMLKHVYTFTPMFKNS